MSKVKIERFLKKTLGDCFYFIFGRTLGIRISNFLLNWGRFDRENNIDSNGELLIQKLVIDLPISEKQKLTFDVGANIGEWASNFLIKVPNSQFKVVAFEAASATFKTLSINFRTAGFGTMATPIHAAVSEKVGSATFFTHGPEIGTNSLIEYGHAFQETTLVTTIDAYCKAEGIQHITFLKSDTEGGDFAVIKGASSLIAMGQIEVIQFEYNHRWINARCYLKDVFDFFAGQSYRIGKITSKGVLFFDHWKPEMESFREANYLICKSKWTQHFMRADSHVEL